MVNLDSKDGFVVVKAKGLIEWIDAHLFETIVVTVGISLVLLVGSGVNIWVAYTGFRDNVTKQFRLQYLSGEIGRLDEVLTMSARMGAATGNSSWEKRYRDNEPALGKVIEDIIFLAPFYKQETEKTKVANDKLVEMEYRSFELVKQGKSREALALLLGNDYELQKQIYKLGNDNALAQIQQETDMQLAVYSQRLLWSFWFAVCSLLFLVFSWAVIGSRVSYYIRERERAQKALQELNASLSAKSSEIEMQRQAISAENEVLQEDIGHLLDVVSTLEEGDFTIQADVNERATGLVADILNRLIEELTRIMLDFVKTARDVQGSTVLLEGLAVSVSNVSQEQVESVGSLKGLMGMVSELSKRTAAEANSALERVRETISFVKVGIESMNAMGEGIGYLSDSRDSIIRRSEMLVDIGALAQSFVREQRRVATLTKVLAFNASTLATRAALQQDPEFFASVVSEFEVIASQINGLASETQKALVVLQQRTDQLEIVASGLSQDVRDIDGYVSDFTGSVGRSREIFGEIERVTGGLLRVEEVVRDSSLSILDAAVNTEQALSVIEDGLLETNSAAKKTQGQSGVLEGLASLLLQRLSFFRFRGDEQ